MATTREESNAAARNAAEKLMDVARGKAAVATDKQRDRFAQTAADAKRAGWNRTAGPRHTNE